MFDQKFPIGTKVRLIHSMSDWGLRLVTGTVTAFDPEDGLYDVDPDQDTGFLGFTGFCHEADIVEVK